MHGDIHTHLTNAVTCTERLVPDILPSSQPVLCRHTPTHSKPVLSPRRWCVDGCLLVLLLLRLLLLRALGGPIGPEDQALDVMFGKRVLQVCLASGKDFVPFGVGTMMETLERPIRLHLCIPLRKHRKNLGLVVRRSGLHCEFVFAFYVQLAKGSVLPERELCVFLDQFDVAVVLGLLLRFGLGLGLRLR
jgi:hypothetical protein